VTNLTDSSGTVIKTYDYDAFGVELNPDPNDTNPFHYCGEYFDKETGDIYLRARYYSASRGRFNAQDPIRSGNNWYVYCGGNPIALSDPLGLLPEDHDEFDTTDDKGKTDSTIANELDALGEEWKAANEIGDTDAMDKAAKKAALLRRIARVNNARGKRSQATVVQAYKNVVDNEAWINIASTVTGMSKEEIATVIVLETLQGRNAVTWSDNAGMFFGADVSIGLCQIRVSTARSALSYFNEREGKPKTEYDNQTLQKMLKDNRNNIYFCALVLYQITYQDEISDFGTKYTVYSESPDTEGYKDPNSEAAIGANAYLSAVSPYFS